MHVTIGHLLEIRVRLTPAVMLAETLKHLRRGIDQKSNLSLMVSEEADDVRRRGLAAAEDGPTGQRIMCPKSESG